MPSHGVRFLYQSVFSLVTGKVIGHEALAVPAGGTLTELRYAAHRADALESTDVDLAVAAAEQCAATGAEPLHLNLLAITVARTPKLLVELHHRLAALGSSPGGIVLELGPPFSGLDKAALGAGVERLRGYGYGIAVDDLGNGDVPLTALALLAPDLLKLDAQVVAGLPEDAARAGCADAVHALAARLGARVLAAGVRTAAQFAALQRIQIAGVQGDYLAEPRPQPQPADSVAALLAGPADPVQPAERIPTAGDLLRPAVTLPATVTADEVRTALAAYREAGGVVLLDGDSRPTGTLHRDRFLLAVTGAYGHALRARRPAGALAEEPDTVAADTDVLELIDRVAARGQTRANDDFVVVDDAGICRGSLPVLQIVRAMADFRTRRAEGLNPLTKLPGTATVAADVRGRLRAGAVFAVTWLDVDRFKLVNDEYGFAAGDEVIRTVATRLREAAAGAPGSRITHVGGDDFLLLAELDHVLAVLRTVLAEPVPVAGAEVTLSVATLVCLPDAVRSYEQVSELLAPLKKQAKSLPGTSWVLGRAGASRVDVLRGDRPPAARPAGEREPGGAPVATE